jgi:hypothetical protein
MLFDMKTLAAIERGDITVAFRNWKRPTVKEGGTLKTAVGVLAIDAVARVDPGGITAAEAAAAGFGSADEVRSALAERADSVVYRIRFHLAGPDPRIDLRERATLTDEEWARLRGRLGRWDLASPEGPWTGAALRLIGSSPGVRAADLAPAVGQAKDRFKRNVRKLKGLGLTESMETGYRLSPRGRSVLARLAGAE